MFLPGGRKYVDKIIYIYADYRVDKVELDYQ
jgi:hypothetical protein